MTTDPWEEGRLAFAEGRALNTCPYEEADPSRIDWEGGWMEAEEERDE